MAWHLLLVEKCLSLLDKRRIKGRAVCKHYGYEGYLKENCFQLVGYPKCYKGKHVVKGNKRAIAIANVEKVEQFSDTLFYYNLHV